MAEIKNKRVACCGCRGTLHLARYIHIPRTLISRQEVTRKERFWEVYTLCKKRDGSRKTFRARI